ncbi:hypothetical protein AADZ90_021865 [Aestuariibius sp. 2305UL40-4]|uniref:hypothetical protein n=1 Tax=Aestuariibius violaceus TaxID=3234132 RepID=UPI00345E810C
MKSNVELIEEIKGYIDNSDAEKIAIALKGIIEQLPYIQTELMEHAYSAYEDGGDTGAILSLVESGCLPFFHTDACDAVVQSFKPFSILNQKWAHAEMPSESFARLLDQLFTNYFPQHKTMFEGQSRQADLQITENEGTWEEVRIRLSKPKAYRAFIQNTL